MRRTWLLLGSLVVASIVWSPGVAEVQAADREQMLATAVRVADRLAQLRTPRRSWHSAPYLVGSALLWEQLQCDGIARDAIAAEQLWQRVDEVTSAANDPVLHGDRAAYAQAALDLLRLAPPEETSFRQAKLAVTDAPLRFAELVVNHDAGTGGPLDGWWVTGGYGSRYWQDDLFMVVPWLALRGSSRALLPADSKARNLAYEWIEAYAFDHRRSLGEEPDSSVPSQPERRRSGWDLADQASGRLLLDAGSGLWWHDVRGVGTDRFWGRGNGWVAAALVRAQYYLDRPYSGGRFAQVSDHIDLRRMVSDMAEHLLGCRDTYGTWNADLNGHDPVTTAESSGTALLVYALARAVNEGWLDEQQYGPVVLKAFQALSCLVDDHGDLHRIQRPADSADGRELLPSDHAEFDLSYGVGAFLMAAAEVARLPQEWLQQLEETEVAVLDRSRFTIAGNRLLISVRELGEIGHQAATARSLAAISGQQLLAAGYGNGTVWVEQGGEGEVVLFLQPQPRPVTRTSVVAAVARTAGVGGRWWHTDLVLLNPGSCDTTAQLELRLRGSQSRPALLSAQVPAGASLVLPDLLATGFLATGAGSLAVHASGPLLVSSSIWTETDSGRRGQRLPGLERVQGLSAGEEVLLLQLERDDTRYTNLGCANLSTRPAEVVFRVVSDGGTVLGEIAATLPPHGSWQRTDALPAHAGGCHAVVSGRGDLLSLLPYASVIDRRSGDPSLVLPQRVTGAVAAGHTILLPAAAHTPGINGATWRTDAVLHSCGSEPATVLIGVLPGPRRSAPQPVRLSGLEPGTSRRLPDLLGTLFGFRGTAAVSCTVSSGAVLLTSRTFTRSAAGEMGQVIPGVAESRSLRPGERAVIGHLGHSPDRSRGERTNLGLINAAPLPIEVRIDLVAGVGELLASGEIVLPASSHCQLNDVFRPFTGDLLAGASARVSSDTAGARLLAYASVVDNRSGDPLYLPAHRFP